MFKLFSLTIFFFVLLLSHSSVLAVAAKSTDDCKVILINPNGDQLKRLVKANETKVKLLGDDLGIQFFVVNTKTCYCKVTASNPSKDPDAQKSASLKVKPEENQNGLTYFLPFVAKSISLKCVKQA